MTPPTAVRLATPGDAEEIAALVHAAYRGPESRRGWTTEADLLGGQRTDAAMVRELIEGPTSVILVGLAESGGGDEPEEPARRLLACCLLEHRGDAAYLGMFAVRPGLQGGGLGRTMLEAAEHLAGDVWGAGRVELTVLNRRPELIAWYERRGFTLTGEEHAFPYGDERFGQPRHPDLVLLAMSKPVASRPADSALQLSAGELRTAVSTAATETAGVRAADLSAVISATD